MNASVLTIASFIISCKRSDVLLKPFIQKHLRMYLQLKIIYLLVIASTRAVQLQIFTKCALCRHNRTYKTKLWILTKRNFRRNLSIFTLQFQMEWGAQRKNYVTFEVKMYLLLSFRRFTMEFYAIGCWSISIFLKIHKNCSWMMKWNVQNVSDCFCFQKRSANS